MKHPEALAIAEQYVELLRPHCSRIEIAGSIRRKKPEVKDIEIVCIPLPYETGLFESGIATIVNQWKKVKGELSYGESRYTQRVLPEGIKLDLFFATEQNYGLIMVYRTGSSVFNIQWLQMAAERGYDMRDGQLFIKGKRDPTPVYEEADLFHRIGMDFPQPEQRSV